jgi:hypothetical protein
MRVECDVSYEDLESDDGLRTIPGVVVTCTECDHAEEAYGTTDRSIRRCLVLMRENCPEGEENFYVADGA